MGGAVFNHNGSVTITASTLVNIVLLRIATNNGSGLGGAIFNLNGTVLIQGSTITSNTVANATAGGSALYNLVYDGALARTATVTLASSTLANNLGAADVANDQPSRLGVQHVSAAQPRQCCAHRQWADDSAQALTNSGGTVMGSTPFVAPVALNLTAISNAVGCAYSAILALGDQPERVQHDRLVPVRPLYSLWRKHIACWFGTQFRIANCHQCHREQSQPGFIYHFLRLCDQRCRRHGQPGRGGRGAPVEQAR